MAVQKYDNPLMTPEMLQRYEFLNKEPYPQKWVSTFSPKQTFDSESAAAEFDAQARRTNLADQIRSQNTLSRWTGEGFGGPDENLRVMVDLLAGAGIDDIRDFGKVTKPSYVESYVKPEIKTKSTPYGDVDEFTGRYYADLESGRYYVDEKDVKPFNIGYSPEDSATLHLAKIPVGEETYWGNKKTGQPIYQNYNMADPSGNVWQGTYAGHGRTNFGVQFASDGTPYFYTQFGGDTSSMADIAPVLSILSVVPTPLQPFAAAANAIIAIDNGNTLGGLAALAGIPGVSEAVGAAGLANVAKAIQTANQVSGLVNAIESGNVLGAVSSVAGLTGAGSMEIGNTGLTVSDAMRAVNLVKAIDSGDPISVFNSAVSFGRSPGFSKLLNRQSTTVDADGQKVADTVGDDFVADISNPSSPNYLGKADENLGSAFASADEIKPDSDAFFKTVSNLSSLGNIGANFISYPNQFFDLSQAEDPNFIGPVDSLNVPGSENLADLTGGQGVDVAGPISVALPYNLENLPKDFPVPTGFRVLSREEMFGSPREMRDAGIDVRYSDPIDGREAIIVPDSVGKIRYEDGEVLIEPAKPLEVIPGPTQTEPSEDEETVVSTDTSLPGGEGEDGSSDFGGVTVPGGETDASFDLGVPSDKPSTGSPTDTTDSGEAGVSTDTSLPRGTGGGDTVDGGVSTDTSLPGDGTTGGGDGTILPKGDGPEVDTGVSTDTSLPEVEEKEEETPQSCGAGYHWDADRQLCVPDSDEEEDDECPAGYVRNLNTGACEPVGGTDEPNPCGDGYHWDESRQICVPDSDEEEDKECPPGYARNPSTGECELIEEKKPQDCGEGYHFDEDRQLCVPDSDEEEDDECPEGYIRNLNTGACEPVSTSTGGGGGGGGTPIKRPVSVLSIPSSFYLPERPIVSAPSINDDPVMRGALPEMPQETKFQGPLDQFLKIATGASFTPQKQPQQQPTQQQAGTMNDRLSYPQGGSDYFSYGQQSDIESNLYPQFGQAPVEPEGALQFKQGGMATPLMAGGGTTRYGRYAGGGLNVINHSGKQRLDFRRGAAVTGPGDGQSDDIPAMLADGEFVFPADVVAALGNGSTKAGSDKLYDMMHSIRAYHRSAKPKDLPPPAKKSPLDYLKKSKKARS